MRILLQSHAKSTCVFTYVFLTGKAPSKTIRSKEVTHSTHLDLFLNFAKHVCTLGNTVNPFSDLFLIIKRKYVSPEEFKVCINGHS